MAWQGNYSKFFIGGEWVDPQTTNTFDVVSPYSGALLATVPAASTGDVDRAVAAARQSFDSGSWRRLDLEERKSVLARLGELLIENIDELGTLISEEVGLPISQSKPSQVGAAKAIIDTNLEVVDSYPWADLRRSPLGNALVERVPIGVVAAIVPWNAPLSVTMLKLAPALLAGCSVVLKPSPEAPLFSYYLAELVQQAGLPAGVLNIVTADRTESEYLVVHPDVDKVSFTGSSAAGKLIASLCGDRVRRYTLELGGKSAAIVLEDADIDQVVAALRTLSFRYSGQACTNKTRVVVVRQREKELVEKLAQAVRGLTWGDPLDPGTDVGPIVSTRQRDQIETYIDRGIEQGATVVVGGGRPAGQENTIFIQPTLLTDVTNDMEIAQQEVFGPVVAVIAVDDEEEAIAVANDSDYGLSGAVFSAEPSRALGVARRIDTGSVEINGASTGFKAALGGFKRSGIGRESSLEGFDAFVEVKSYGIDPAFADALAASEDPAA